MSLPASALLADATDGRHALSCGAQSVGAQSDVTGSVEPDVDVAVVGVGSVGSMALWRLSRQPGLRVLGIEQFGPPETHGSFSGQSRHFRTATKAGAMYVPALLEARRLWRELEAESGRQVLVPVGALTLCPEGHPDLTSTLRSITSHDLPHRVLADTELRTAYPQFSVRDGDVGILDDLGGALLPEVAVAAATRLAASRGARVHYGTAVLGLQDDRDGVTITTTAGPVRARRVVVTAGPWTTRLLPDLAGLLRAKAYALTWFGPRDADRFGAELLPVVKRDLDGVHASGAPTLDGYRVMVRRNLTGHPTRQQQALLPERPTGGDLDRTHQAARRLVPAVAPEPVRWSIHHDCATRDRVPIIDRVGSGHVIVAAGMSGNGFKFAPTYGQVLAELATDTQSRHRHPMFTIAGHLRRAADAA